MYTRSGAQIRIAGDVVVKVHRVGTDPAALATRLRIAARLGSTADGVLLPPLSAEPELLDGIGPQWVSRWPRVQVLDLDPARAPWAHAGRLLARLHLATVVDGDREVDQGGPRRLRRALTAGAEGTTGAEAHVITRAAALLPPTVWRPAAPGRPVTLVHGDWHLGQLGRLPAEQHWRLIDVDDIGVGDPVWDLARPAGFWAAGLLPDGDWDAFIGAYRDARGPALPPGPADPWPVLDVVARAAIIGSAATGVHSSHADPESQALLVGACARMSS